MTTSSDVTGTTATAPETAEDYSKTEEYKPKDNLPTQQATTDEIPPPYARIVSASSEVYGEHVSVLYDNARAQREMDFLRLNEALESRRR